MKCNEWIAYYREFPDKFIEDFHGIKLLRYQKLFLRILRRKKDVPVMNLWRSRYLSYKYIQTLCETIWDNPEVADQIKGHRMSDKEFSSFINEEITRATTLPENINDVLEPFCAGKQADDIYIDEGIYFASSKKEGE